MYTGFIKRIIDITVSIFLIIVLIPVFIVIVAMVYVSDRGPIIFKSVRVGYKNRPFVMYKFRTFKADTPEIASNLLVNPSEHFIYLGKFLRKSSLDEIPQLFNVIKGDMSLIGPRPSLLSQNKLNKLRLIHNVNSLRPGITGLAQINGRDLHSDEEKAYFDAEYLKKISFLYDLKIALITLTKLFSTKSILH